MAEIVATGNLAEDASLRFTPSGSPVLNFRLGDSKSKKNGDQWEKVAQNWFNVSVWGQLAELLADKLTKGARVKITGEFYQREYDRTDGSKGVSLDVNAWGVQVIPKRESAGYQQSTPAPPAANGGWNTPASDPWGAPAGGNGGWGAPQAAQPPF